MPYFLYAKRPRGANQLAEMIVDISTGEIEDAISKNKKDQDTQGRAGGLKGGKARVERHSSPKNVQTLYELPH